MLAVMPGLPALNIGVYFDSLAAIMLLLISFIGAVICRYSVRYLDGDPQQGHFLCRMLFTLGSVLLLVISRNLLQFTAAWIAMTALPIASSIITFAPRLDAFTKTQRAIFGWAPKTG